MCVCNFSMCCQVVISLARNMSKCLFLYPIQTFFFFFFFFLLISWVISSISKFDWASFLMFKGHLRLAYFKIWIRSCNTFSIFLIAPHHLWNTAQTPEMAFPPLQPPFLHPALQAHWTAFCPKNAMLSFASVCSVLHPRPHVVKKYCLLGLSPSAESSMWSALSF